MRDSGVNWERKKRPACASEIIAGFSFGCRLRRNRRRRVWFLATNLVILFHFILVTNYQIQKQKYILVSIFGNLGTNMK